MKIKLYEAAETVRSLLEQIDPETGELPEGLEPAREIVIHKAQAVTAFILSNDAEADMVEAHAKHLLDQVKSARKRGDWLRTYLRTNMAATGILSIKSDDGTFSAKLEKERDVSVDVFDETQLPQDYMAEVPASFKPDKKLIRKALDDGYDVPGARLNRKDRLVLK
jgi:hypothetical protein